MTVKREGLNVKKAKPMRSSRDEHRRQKDSDRGTEAGGKKVKPSESMQRAEPSPAQNEGQAKAERSTWERVMGRQNLFAALRRVERNGGARGIDGMTVEELGAYLKEHWLEIREQLDTGKYEPKAVRRVEIPKPDGGVRLLGIPTVIDRLIQQAIAQELTPKYEREFSKHS